MVTGVAQIGQGVLKNNLHQVMYTKILSIHLIAVARIMIFVIQNVEKIILVTLLKEIYA